MQDLAQKLRAEVGMVTWSDLRAHVQRGNVFVVATPVDLVTVGIALARDDSQLVAGWLRAQQLARSTADDVTRWQAMPAQRFESLIVAPFVLVKPHRGPAQNGSETQV